MAVAAEIIRLPESLLYSQAAMYVCDRDGVIVQVSARAIELWGRAPRLGHPDERYCGAFRIYALDGSPVPHARCLTAGVLRDGRPVRDGRVVYERPDGSRFQVRVDINPLKSRAGEIVGALNIFEEAPVAEISERDVGNRLIDVSTLKDLKDDAEQRVTEQAALFRYTDRLYRATTLKHTYDAALEAIIVTLRCSRASILQFDSEGVMRFVAARGLSSAYMAAVEGHSPWKPGEKFPDPILISDIAIADEPDTLKATVLAEGIRGIAFFPLVRGGDVFGKFMAYYETPHTFTSAEVDMALTIARQLGFSLEQARAHEARSLAERRLAASERRLRAIIDQTRAGIAETDLAGRFLRVNDRYCEITGYTRAELLEKSLHEITHPDDAARNVALFNQMIADGKDFAIEKRYITKSGDPIWVGKTVSLAADSAGNPSRVVAVAVDIGDRKRAEEQQRLLLREMSHRIKNMFAVVGSLVTLSASAAGSAKDLAKALRGRIAALASAHDLTRPGLINPMGQQSERPTLDMLARTILKPYGSTEEGARFAIAGPTIPIGTSAATNLALILHELATNAAKYGALSVPGGSIAIGWTVEGDTLRLTWREAGGPTITGVPDHKGFGSIVTREAIAGHGGNLTYKWDHDGLVVHLSARIDRLAS